LVQQAVLMLAEAIDPFSSKGVKGDLAVMKVASAACVAPLRRRGKMLGALAEEFLPVRTEEPHQRWGLKEELSTAVSRDFDYQVTISQAGPVLCYFDVGSASGSFT
jgi:hypothetical protein